ncbi:MAG: 2-phosphosulfolactate phosphatase [Spirochaetales bacterium]|uniref:Probable 2-phosphosulfolactate phosphatase n=1 Tax=Candidatus Thalassospirochaeta sargassi TaxID=3119039 RepID=A0AAJ1IEK1_9SPIO|nr:2-phosphosulfolactate phosphatase [Spirochaetales bacterium]
MKINIIAPDSNTEKIEGFTIVVDVFRAFSTAYYIQEKNPLKYILSESIEHSWQLKNANKNSILIGEREGYKIEGFNFGNSPTEIAGSDFSRNVVIHTTTNGTRGVLAQPVDNEVVVGSFVNLQALLNHIYDNKIQTVNIYCTAPKDTLYGEEDWVFADYLKARLTGENSSFEDVIVKLRNGTGRGFVEETFAPYTDFLMCMDINRFDFILRRKLINGLILLEVV